MQLLIYKYEHFHFKQGETLNETYSRFQKLLNGLKLYGRVYATKDINLKFLRSLPNEWKPMTISVRHSHEFKDYNLEKRYGVLKTSELEIQQDEEIEQGQRKEKTVALVTKHKEDKSEEAGEVDVSSAPNRNVCEGTSELSKGKEKVEAKDYSMNQEDLDDIDEYLAFLLRRFSKLKFKRNLSVFRPTPHFRKEGQQNKSFVDGSKFKCYNCGIT